MAVVLLSQPIRATVTVAHHFHRHGLIRQRRQHRPLAPFLKARDGKAVCNGDALGPLLRRVAKQYGVALQVAVFVRIMGKDLVISGLGREIAVQHIVQVQPRIPVEGRPGQGHRLAVEADLPFFLAVSVCFAAV